MTETRKTALVTGASRGIGKAIALQLAMQGLNVIVHYKREAAEAEAVVQAIQQHGVQAAALQADLSAAEAAIALGHAAWGVWGGIDVLVNNAGVSYKKHFLDNTPEDVDGFMNVNYKGALFLMQTVARHMVNEGRGGSIACITSVNGIRPGIGLSAYGASKAALESMVKSAAMELAPHNIRVNSFAVGAVETDINAGVRQQPELLREVNAGIPMGRFGLPEEVAAVVSSMLLNDQYMTGSTITVDGGLLLMRGYGKTAPYTTKDQNT